MKNVRSVHFKICFVYINLKNKIRAESVLPPISELEGYAKVFALTFYFIPFLILWLFFYIFVYSKYTLWQFQNGKVSLYSSKIDQDTRNIVKIRKLKNYSFCSKNIIFEQKLLFFNFGIFTRSLVSWSIFGLYRPTLPFWNWQSMYFEYINR